MECEHFNVKICDECNNMNHDKDKSFQNIYAN